MLSTGVKGKIFDTTVTVAAGSADGSASLLANFKAVKRARPGDAVGQEPAAFLKSDERRFGRRAEVTIDFAWIEAEFLQLLLQSDDGLPL